MLIQWKDNKVVFFIFFYCWLALVQQCNSPEEKMFFLCPEALQAYDKYMGYVDLVDFDKK